MGETPNDIRNEVAQARARLGQNLNQLEYRVKEGINWRLQFDRRPWLFCGIAFGLAFLVGLATTPKAR